MDDRPPGPSKGLVGALDQVLPALSQDLDCHVLGDHVVLDELTDEVEIGLAGRREADLDLLVAHLDQESEHAALALGRHGIDERLVAVAEVDGAPTRGHGGAAGRPLAVGQIDREDVLVGAVALHGHAAGPLARDGIAVGNRGRRIG